MISLIAFGMNRECFSSYYRTDASLSSSMAWMALLNLYVKSGKLLVTLKTKSGYSVSHLRWKFLLWQKIMAFFTFLVGRAWIRSRALWSWAIDPLQISRMLSWTWLRDKKDSNPMF